jgi:hypothetical protein
MLKEPSKILLFLSAVLYTHCATGQKQRYLKIYQNTDYVQQESSYRNSQRLIANARNYHLYLKRISVSISVIKPKLAHEIELSYSSRSIPIVWSKGYNDGSFHETTRFVSFQYELLRPVSLYKKKLKLLLGSGLTSYFLKFAKEPTVTDAYPLYQSHVGGTLSANAHIVYSPTKKLIFDANFKMGIYDARYISTQILNPAIPVRQQRNSTMEYSFFPHAYTFRIGVGYLLAK